MKFINKTDKDICDKLTALLQICKTDQQKNECLQLRTNYILDTIEVICQYIKTISLQEQYLVGIKYIDIVTTMNLIQKMDAIYNSIQNKTEAMIRHYTSVIVDIHIRKQDYRTCPECGSKMYIKPYRSEMTCEKCSYNIILKGISFEDKTNDMQTKKNGGSETFKHLKKQFDHLFAHTQPNLKEDEYEKIEKWIATNIAKHQDSIVAADYRQCLKELKLTKYNPSVPYLMRRCSKIKIYDLTYDQYKNFTNIANKVIPSIEQVCNGKTEKLKYYAYIIIKILEVVLADEPQNLTTLKRCVYYKSESTTVRQDLIWKEVCRLVSEIKPTKTIRN